MVDAWYKWTGWNDFVFKKQRAIESRGSEKQTFKSSCWGGAVAKGLQRSNRWRVPMFRLLAKDPDKLTHPFHGSSRISTALVKFTSAWRCREPSVTLGKRGILEQDVRCNRVSCCCQNALAFRRCCVETSSWTIPMWRRPVFRYFVLDLERDDGNEEPSYWWLYQEHVMLQTGFGANLSLAGSSWRLGDEWIELERLSAPVFKWGGYSSCKHVQSELDAASKPFFWSSQCRMLAACANRCIVVSLTASRALMWLFFGNRGIWHCQSTYVEVLK